MKYFIIEGIDGAGKTSQFNLLKEKYANNLKYIFIKEPNSATGFKDIKETLLDSKDTSQMTRFFMFLALRSQIFSKLDLNSKKIIISERSFISSVAYSDLSLKASLDINMIAINRLKVNKIIMLNIDKKTLQKRLENKKLDAIESKGIKYLLNVQERMRKAIKLYQNYINNKVKILSIDVNDKDIESMHKDIMKFLFD